MICRLRRLFPAASSTSRFVQAACLAILAVALLAGCSTTARNSEAATAAPPSPYARIAESSTNHLELLIAAKQFVPRRGRGPSIWLVGAAHLGDSNYFSNLQALLDRRSLVLYEGIGSRPRNASPRVHRAPLASESTNSETLSRPQATSGLQLSMANALGLKFQLDAIDYDRDNFKHCDLSVQELRGILVESAARASTNVQASATTASFEGLIGAIQGGSTVDTLVQMLARVLGTNPKFRAIGRYALIEMLGQIQGDPRQLKGLPEDMKQLLELLLIDRNLKVLEELRTDLEELGPKESIAVFYGCGHMPDLEARLRRELDYRPARETWLTAFDVDLQGAGISPSERDWIQSLLKFVK